jgi:hypothetical protein
MTCDQAAHVGFLSHSYIHEGCISWYDNDKRGGSGKDGWWWGSPGGWSQGTSIGLPGRGATTHLPRGPLMCRASVRLAGLNTSPMSLNPLIMTKSVHQEGIGCRRPPPTKSVPPKRGSGASDRRRPNLCPPKRGSEARNAHALHGESHHLVRSAPTSHDDSHRVYRNVPTR